jgi:hypothetical protein
MQPLIVTLNAQNRNAKSSLQNLADKIHVSKQGEIILVARKVPAENNQLANSQDTNKTAASIRRVIIQKASIQRRSSECWNITRVRSLTPSLHVSMCRMQSQN